MRRSQHIQQMLTPKIVGSTSRIAGLAAAVHDFPAPLGARCRIHREGEQSIEAEVVGFTGSEDCCVLV